MNQNKMLIAVHEIIDNLDNGNTPKENLIEAMKLSLNYWLPMSKDEAFIVALSAVITFYGEDSIEAKSLIYEGEMIKLLDSKSGVFPEQPENYVQFAVIDCWKKAGAF